MAGKKSKKKGSPKIVVTGDVTIDWLEVAIPPMAIDEESPTVQSWQTYVGSRQFARVGGTLLLAEFVKAATGEEVLSPQLKRIENIPPTKIIHFMALLDQFPYSTEKGGQKDFVYRVKEYKGYAGPAKSSPNFLKVENDSPEAKIVIIDDAGNGFFNSPKDYWPSALTQGKPHLVVFKMSQPNSQGELWKELQKSYADRLVVVIGADDLRRSGVMMSRRLCWERTAKDFVWQMASNPALISLNNCAYLVVRFGVEGAILYRRRAGVVESRLFFDPKIGEDGFSDFYPGKMMGVGSVFVAALVSHIYSKGLEGMEEGVRQGLLTSRRLWQRGFGQNLAKLDYPGPEIFAATEEERAAISEVMVPNPTEIESADRDYWCILNDLAQAGLEDIAYNYVIFGRDPTLERIPIGCFRNLRTFDRFEIESFSSIKNLIREYLDTPEIARPLSIAVFGPPGSGKSFGVTEVAKSVAPGKLAEDPLEFNLSQFKSTEELMAAFHIVRDVSLRGKIPLVFFDEFDCDFGGKLGWLKNFLMPMQDGQFSDGRDIHPIGRAIFIFAGGTCHTFEEFCKKENDLEFRNAKGIDFVSRLRGYVNIKGPNPIDESDRFYMIRRALFLRFLLEKKAKNIFDKNKKCRIDPGVLRAMIKIPRYKHGIRSLEAIIEMSLLTERKSFEQASLPSAAQLELHVDAEMFSRLVVRDVILGGARETLAKAIHEKFRLDHKKDKSPDEPGMRPWNKLDEHYKESNRQQADHIPVKLKAINCDFVPVVGRKPKLMQFTNKEIEIMARMEHERWNREKFLDGWSYGKVKDEKKKTHPYLVEWEKLSPKIQEYDRQAVRAIPELLAKAGFEIYSLKEK